MLRMPFGGRQVNGWVLEIDVEPQEGMTLLPLSKYRSVGPSWGDSARTLGRRTLVGRLNSFLNTASPPKTFLFLAKVK